MLETMQVVVLLAIFQLSVACTNTTHRESCLMMRHHLIIRVSSASGTDNSSCLLGDNPCATLNKALEGFKMKYSSTTIYVRPGNYTLEHGEVNHITDKDHISIIGSGETNTIISCKPSAGLYISNSINVTIESIALYYCGYHASLISQSFSAPAASMFFIHCHNTSVNNVAVKKSNGSGLSFHMVDIIAISNSSITDGAINDEDNVNGGIVIRGGEYCSITQSSITNNYYNQMSQEDVKGGGLVIIQSPVIINITSCIIANNSQGLYVYNDIHDHTIILNKTLVAVNMNDSVIVIRNSVLCVDLVDSIIKDTLNVSIERYTDYKDSSSMAVCALAENSLEISTSCSRNRNCNFPSMNFQITCKSVEKARIAPGKCSDKESEDFTSHCPVTYSAVYYNGTYSCWDNHQGELCSQCIEGHSVAINSPYMPCVPCDDTMTVLKGWGLLIVLDFIPVTVMVAVIAVLNVNLNQGSLKAYIFFSQMTSIYSPLMSYPIPMSNYVNHHFNQRILRLLFSHFNIWSLEFINYPSCNLFDGSNHCNSMSICISPNTTPLGAIVFRYVIGFYPFLLLALSYACIIMYDRGYRCIVCVVRPLHRLMARWFWRMFNIQPSLPHTIASVYTLCFTHLAVTSFKLLQFTTYDNQLRFFYDGSQRYFSGWHGAAGTLALIVLIAFIIVPIMYLTLHPFNWFQKCLNKIKAQRLSLLVSMTDVFTAPYKNGSDEKTRDYRYFTASNYILQIIAMFLSVYPTLVKSNWVYFVFFSQSVLGLITIILTIIFRPYKRAIHVLADVLVLITLIGNSFAVFILSLVVGVRVIATFQLSTYLPVSCIFFLSVLVYFCFWVKKKLNIFYRNYRSLKARHQIIDNPDLDADTSDSALLLPDRLANPTDYQ